MQLTQTNISLGSHDIVSMSLQSTIPSQNDGNAIAIEKRIELKQSQIYIVAVVVEFEMDGF